MKQKTGELIELKINIKTEKFDGKISYPNNDQIMSPKEFKDNIEKIQTKDKY
ncbi:hypothetical protein [Xylocopilactobacillus apis]|uniref:Uncharacterized protein n=1 Tax=Xylocopilactobacillus apis TaxID=2932183 RepID=A0AAU9D4Z2_9LACO|nr:hypothetical protein [Xylocopilactobacillus apis]BDR55892.1 hypothetical protein KIMC2_04540 [Xylocopilactobacillus apis]